jgi:hypothetical protein
MAAFRAGRGVHFYVKAETFSRVSYLHYPGYTAVSVGVTPHKVRSIRYDEVNMGFQPTHVFQL